MIVPVGHSFEGGEKEAAEFINFLMRMGALNRDSKYGYSSYGISVDVDDSLLTRESDPLPFQAAEAVNLIIVAVQDFREATGRERRMDPHAIHLELVGEDKYQVSAFLRFVRRMPDISLATRTLSVGPALGPIVELRFHDMSTSSAGREGMRDRARVYLALWRSQRAQNYAAFLPVDSVEGANHER